MTEGQSRWGPRRRGATRVLNAFNHLLHREIGEHLAMTPGSSGHNLDWESGFVAGLQHVKKHLVGIVEKVVQEMRDEESG